MINTEMITSVSSHYLRKVNILNQEKKPSVFKGETKINKMLWIFHYWTDLPFLTFSRREVYA